VNERHCIDDVQIDLLQRTDVLRFKFVMVIGIDICDAAASGRDAIQPTRVELGLP
jgi:hypothetical protein